MRNPVFDLLRIILTVFVINVHIRILTAVSPNFLEPFTWYTVPLFVVLSFYLTGTKDVRKRLPRLILPFLFWSCIGFALYPDLLNGKNILLQLFGGQVVNTPLYYLVLLFWFTVIHWFIRRFAGRSKVLIYSFIVLFAFFLEYSGRNFALFSPMSTIIGKTYGRFVELIPYVTVGLAFAYAAKKIRYNYFLLSSFLFFILCFFSSFISQPPDFHFSGLKVFFGVIAVFSLFLWFSQFRLPQRIASAISFLGRYSFGVFLSHYVILEVLLRVFPGIERYIALHQVAFLAMFTVSVYIFCYVFDTIARRRASFLVK